MLNIVRKIKNSAKINLFALKEARKIARHIAMTENRSITECLPDVATHLPKSKQIVFGWTQELRPTHAVALPSNW